MLDLITYNFKKYLRNKEGFLFGILFPLAFAMIYTMALGNLAKGELTMEAIPVAVVQKSSSPESQQFVKTLGVKGQINKNKLVSDDKHSKAVLVYTLTDEKTALNYVDQKIVDYVIYVKTTKDKVLLNVKMNTALVTDFKTNVVYQYLKSYSGIYNVTMTSLKSQEINLAAIRRLPKILGEFDHNKVIQRHSNANGSNNYFYACMGYICIFFMSVGVQIALMNEGNHSVTGLRELISPKSKLIRSFITFLVLFLISLMVAFMAYGLFIMNGILFANQGLEMCLLIFLGVLVSILSGWFTGIILKVKESTLIGITVSIPLVLGALSGMMAEPIKQKIVQNVPWLNKINPLSLISDGIYYLTYYPSKTEFYQNIGLLTLWNVVLLVLIVIGLRRGNYESL